MAATGELSREDLKFLQTYLPPASSHIADEISSGDAASPDPSNGQLLERPFVTLTYACSLDSMISLAPGVRTTLSGPDTKSMTHYLRLRHDSILVGAGTATADNPSLNCRYPGATLDMQPRPILLDPSRRFDFHSSQLAQLVKVGRGKEPWFIQRDMSGEAQLRSADSDDLSTSAVRSAKMNAAGSGKLDWVSILRSLKLKGIDSLMIEGGATIINDLLSQPNLVDSVIITIAPTWLGHGGLAISPAAKTDQYGQRLNAAYLENPTWKQFGQDVVLCGKPKR